MELGEAYGSGYMLGGKKHHKKTTKKTTKKRTRGGNFLSDFGDGLEEGLSGVLGVAQQLAPLAGEAGMFGVGRYKKHHPHHIMHHPQPHILHRPHEHEHEKITSASALAHSVQLAKMGKKIGMPNMMHHGGAQIYEGGAQIYEGGGLFSGLERDIEYTAAKARDQRNAQHKRMEAAEHHHGGYGLGGYGLGGSEHYLRKYKHKVETHHNVKELKAAVKKMTKAELQHALLREIKK